MAQLSAWQSVLAFAAAAAVTVLWAVELRDQSTLAAIDWSGGVFAFALLAYFVLVPARRQGLVQWVAIVTAMVLWSLAQSGFWRDRIGIDTSNALRAVTLVSLAASLVLVFMPQTRGVHFRVVAGVCGVSFVSLMAVGRHQWAAGLLLLFALVLVTSHFFDPLSKEVPSGSTNEATSPTPTGEPLPKRSVDGEPLPKEHAAAEPLPPAVEGPFAETVLVVLLRRLAAAQIEAAVDQLGLAVAVAARFLRIGFVVIAFAVLLTVLVEDWSTIIAAIAVGLATAIAWPVGTFLTLFWLIRKLSVSRRGRVMRPIGMAERFQSFWAAGICASTFVLLILSASLWFGLRLDGLMALVLWIAYWAGILLASRAVLVRQDLRAATALALSPEGDAGEDGKAQPDSMIGLVRSQSRHRLPVSAVERRGDELSGLADGNRQTALTLVEEMERDTIAWYVPTNALIWALPAVGFLGTAWHLGSAMTNLATYIGPGAPSAGNPHDITGPLTMAFVILSVALGLSAIGYVTAALTMKADLRCLQALRIRVNLAASAQTSKPVRLKNEAL
jgi:hypothetical protein